MPSTSDAFSPASSSAALAASAANCISLRSSFFENVVCPIPTIAACWVSPPPIFNTSSGTRAEDGYGKSADGGVEQHFNFQADRHLAVGHSHNIGNEANALLEPDQGDDRRLRETE